MKKALAFGALPLVFLLVTAFQSSNSVPAQLAAIQAELSELKTQVASSVPRKFYLTKTLHNGAGALSACAEGYHMASLWEIHETSILRYDTELGLTYDRSAGPPVGDAFGDGWIRLGLWEPGPGPSNHCEFWTSTNSIDRGSTAYLGFAPAQGDRWFVDFDDCNLQSRVWCVQD